jgi:hypothetical protein
MKYHNSLTPAQQSLSHLWDQHLREEFELRDAVATVDTMTNDADVREDLSILMQEF